MDSGFLFIASLAGKNAILDGLGIFFATYLPYFVTLIFIGILLAQKDWRRKLRLFLFSAICVITSMGIIKSILNYAFFRPRPYIEFGMTPLIDPAGTASFPSSHAILFFTLATLMFFWIDRRWGGWFLAGAALIGLARVFVGVHYPIDIIAGAAIGFITPFLIKYFLPEMVSENKGL